MAVGNEWEQRYQDQSTGWDRGAPSPSLDVWLEHTALQPGAQILVPGCGWGHEVLALAERGFRVMAIDIAPSAVTALRECVTAAGFEQAVEVVEGDAFAVSTGNDGAPFDGVYEQTFLCAIDPAARFDYADWIRSALRPGGEWFACFMQVPRAGGPPFHCELEDMRALFGSDDWLWSEPLGRSPHTNGKEERLFLLQRCTPQNA